MATRLIGTDSENPRLPQGVIDASQGTTSADVASGDTLTAANAYTDAVVAAGGIGGGGETVDTGETYRIIMFADGTVRAIPVSATEPAAPGGFARTVRISSVKLTWTAPAGGAASYIVSRDAAEYATTTTNSYRDNAVTVGETYEYTVRAVSSYGLRSDPTGPLSAYIDPALNVAPTVEITTWPATSIALGNRAVVRVNAVDADAQVLAAILGTSAGSLVATADPTVWTLIPRMTAHNLSTTVTDTMAATDTDTATINSTAAADPRVVTRSLLANRINWGSAVDSSVQGPSFSDDPTAPSDYAPGYVSGDPITVSQIFTVLAPCRFTGCRIYKAPNTTGTSIPVTLWSGVTTGTSLASTTIASWTVDAGGWRQVTFPSPVDLVPDTTYVLGYYRADGIYAFSPWVWNAQHTVVWPLVGKTLYTTGAGNFDGNAVHFPTAAITFPTTHNATAYYIDVQVEWDDVMPGYTGGSEYFDQWTTPASSHGFPVAVYNADPPYLADYYTLGVNTQIGGSPDEADRGQPFIDFFDTSGMDWYPYVGTPPNGVVQMQTEEPGAAAQIRGYQLDDEPDMSSSPYRSPTLLRSWVNYMRVRDSTKPIYVGLGKWPVLNQGFGWSPSGGTPLQVNESWREYAALADILASDFYTMTADADPEGRYGIWTYASQVGRMREICDDSKPVWAIVETTSATPAEPTPADVGKAVWASLIAGARGVVFFDHRFGSDFVTQDFAAMLNDPAMSAMVEDLCALLQTLGPALHAADLGLVTAWTSSNTTAGPKGGTFGVPLHYTSRSDGTYQYVFAQAIRPGATTATLTIPAWAGLTVTVLDEARSEVVSGGGVLTDTFAADYSYHLYRRTL